MQMLKLIHGVATLGLTPMQTQMPEVAVAGHDLAGHTELYTPQSSAQVKLEDKRDQFTEPEVLAQVPPWVSTLLVRDITTNTHRLLIKE
ncbi:unnamed protein product [Leptidea sinapis]|uniref:Uncharacterized protein n=1 Tax=Leptidea sinapis TaxID=189913 RepID=A0A5E4PNB4_9NEOP|nr:unnamed protein product [Leptidea sinapis]